MNTQSRLWSAFAVLVFATLMVAIILFSKPARAAGPWYVAPGGNNGNSCLSPAAPCGTINSAIGKASSGDTVYVAVGTYTDSTFSVVVIDKSITLSGGWNSEFTTQSSTSTIDGQGVRRGISVIYGITTVDRFTVQNGVFDEGGGIHNSATLTLSNSFVTNNTASGSGGGIVNYGGMALINSVVGHNVSAYGGGIVNYYTSVLTVTDSAIIGNVAEPGYGGGIINCYECAAILNNSTISGNTAGESGGGIVTVGTLTLNSSTISGNSTAGYGGGIHFNSGTATLQNTILAGNTASTGPDCWRFSDTFIIGTLGYNLIGNNSECSFIPTSTDMTNIDAKLGSLEGIVGYHPLLPGNPAFNAGNPSGCVGSNGPLLTDQRGFPRFGQCDIGAYELQPIGVSTKTVDQSLALPGSSLNYTIALANEGAADIPNVIVTDTLPVALTYTSDSLIATSGSYDYDNGVITWTGSVNMGEVVTITFGATLDPSVSPGTMVTNSAVIHGAGEMITRTAIVEVDFYHAYLSLLRRPLPGIYGQVFLNGAPISDVTLELRFFDGASFSTLVTTTTRAAGGYLFTGIPSLAPGQTYYVRYNNLAGTPGQLWIWGTRTLTSYTAGSNIAIGNFDIADIVLLAPTDGAPIVLPYTFLWTPRLATPSDSYELNVWDPIDDDPYFYTAPPLGYVGSFTLTSLPPGFSPGDEYVWRMWAYGPDGGFGISRGAYLVIFSDSELNIVPNSILPPENPIHFIEALP